MNWRKSFSLVGVLACCFTFVALSGCGAADGPGGGQSAVSFHHEGLDGHEVVHLYEHNNNVFAATDKGLYVRAGTGQWQSAGLEQVHVFDVAFFGAEHFIASVRETVDEVWMDDLVETLDGGETWQAITHNFGGEDMETVFGLHYDSDNNALYATGREALAVSYDEGRSWELLSGIWGGFAQPKNALNRNPASNEIWYGGQNAIEQMVLRRYSVDTGDEVSFPDLLPSPSVIFGIRFDPENDLGVYASGEGGVVKTEDNGESWTPLMGDVDHRFYFDLAIDPQDPQTLYTGGWNKNWETPQPLILEISHDGGVHWVKHRHPSDTLFGGVRSILATTDENQTVLYLGLYGGGIMRAILRSHD